MIGLLVTFCVLLTSRAGVQDRPQYTERVDVARVLVDVRAIDRRGRPLLGLSSSDFHVKIDGKPARVESAQWVTGALTGVEAEPSADRSQSPRPVSGRLVVFLFQKSLEKSRITGFMRMLLNLRDFLDGFTPHDRLAVLSFDSRLRLWLDFTADMDRVRDVLSKNLLFGGPAAANESDVSSFREALEAQRPDRSYSIESSLRLIAEALEPLPGAKTVVLVGHGFGRAGVMVENRYDDTREALQRARASVFCLDVTDADYHSLEIGLQTVAADTGGFFERTHLFGRAALGRLAGALAGHYVLIVEKPLLSRGTHRIQVKLRNHDGSVLARNGYVD
jgi:VWFA-related protein